MTAKLLCTLALLAGCAATPLTDAEREALEYEEFERVEVYRLWHQACVNSGNVIWSEAASCRRRNCVPRKNDWRWDHDRGKEPWAGFPPGRPWIGNRVVCVSERQAVEAMRQLTGYE